MLIKGRKYGKIGIHLQKLAHWCNIGLHNDGRIASIFLVVEVVFLDNY
jgi:hypothetical protein